GADEQGQQAAGLPRIMQRRGAAITIKGLRREYGGGPSRVVALDDIDLTVKPGEFVCIVGPSGCGKSTLLRILAGLDRQTGGTIAVAAAGWAVQNAMVFQESGLFPWMDVAANVGFGLMTRGVPSPEAAERVEAALRLGGRPPGAAGGARAPRGWAGLPGSRRHSPHQLPGGSPQRAATPRPSVPAPAMLLMDEPFAALDAQNRAILQAELVRIWEQTGKTV